ncbi:hypothetical protein [Demequina iriomotensis]|uniref:hypothetical protein n=1 Tax=Demequina iriomotensis TaxID=1536641 RepID=UPI000A66B5E2|nr:hypothetical protein [Demequina iriomotensis]
MTLRTTALIAGALGLLLLIGGLIADAMRPAAFGTPSASLDTSAVLLGPEMVAMAPGGSITIDGTGEITAYSGRVEDAEAWAASRDVTVVTGVPTWDDLATEPFAAPEPSASPAPTASGSAEPSASSSPSGEESAAAEPDASASPSASAEPDAEPAIADIWRDSWSADGELTLETDELPIGLAIVVESADGSPLGSVSMRIDRVVNDGWVTPLKLWGGFLALVGLIALVMMFIDHRHAGSKVETAVAGRKAAAPASPGGRRERREALTASGGIPTVTAEQDPATGEVPVVDEAPEATAPGEDHDREERA